MKRKPGRFVLKDWKVYPKFKVKFSNQWNIIENADLIGELTRFEKCSYCIDHLNTIGCDQKMINTYQCLKHLKHLEIKNNELLIEKYEEPDELNERSIKKHSEFDTKLDVTVKKRIFVDTKSKQSLQNESILNLDDINSILKDFDDEIISKLSNADNSFTFDFLYESNYLDELNESYFDQTEWPSLASLPDDFFDRIQNSDYLDLPILNEPILNRSDQRTGNWAKKISPIKSANQAPSTKKNKITRSMFKPKMFESEKFEDDVEPISRRTRSKRKSESPIRLSFEPFKSKKIKRKNKTDHETIIDQVNSVDEQSSTDDETDREQNLTDDKTDHPVSSRTRSKPKR